jgi:hypothetical protein
MERRGIVQHQHHSRLAGVLHRLGLAERRMPRWVDEAQADRLVEYERAVGTLRVR